MWAHFAPTLARMLLLLPRTPKKRQFGRRRDVSRCLAAFKRRHLKCDSSSLKAERATPSATTHTGCSIDLEVWRPCAELGVGRDRPPRGKLGMPQKDREPVWRTHRQRGRIVNGPGGMAVDRLHTTGALDLDV